MSGQLSLRPTSKTDPEGSFSALVGTHTGRVLLVEWDRRQSRVFASWNVDGMVLGAPRWLDREQFVVGTDADSLHAFVRTSAKSLWTRQVGRCRHRRAPGPLGARCDLGEGLEWHAEGDQLLAVSDGVYALDRQGHLRWQWPPRAGLAQSLASEIRSDAQGNSYFGSQKGYAMSLDAQGELRWIADLGSAISQAPVLVQQHRVCFFAQSGRLSCLDRESGQHLWTFKAPGRAMGPILADGEHGEIWASSSDGSVFSLDAWGHLRWKRRMRGLSPQGLVVRDGQELVVVAGRGESVAYGVERNHGKLVWQARLGQGDPGRVYCPGEDWLMQLRPHGELVGYWMPPGLRAQSLLAKGAVPGLVQSLAR